MRSFERLRPLWLLPKLILKAIGPDLALLTRFFVGCSVYLDILAFIHSEVLRKFNHLIAAILQKYAPWHALVTGEAVSFAVSTNRQYQHAIVLGIILDRNYGRFLAAACWYPADQKGQYEKESQSFHTNPLSKHHFIIYVPLITDSRM